MKWFTHDNDLSRTPQMQFIIAELGMAGYGQALIMLEVLSRETENDGRCQFQIPLAKTTDLRFWVRELHASSVPEVEHAFDVFEQANLITAWRETQIIFAPMLGERVDHWTKRKNRKREAVSENKHQHQHKHNYREATEQLPSDSVVDEATTVEQPSTPVQQPLKPVVGDETHLIGVKEGNDGPRNFPTPSKEMNGGPHNNFQQPIIQKEMEGSARAKSNAEVMGEFREVYNRFNRYPQIGFSPTKPHQKAAIEFYERYGQAVALAAWACFLVRDDAEVVSNGKKQPRAHRLNDFCATGGCETYAKRITDLAPDELEFVAQAADKVADNLRYTSYLKQAENGDLHSFVRFLMIEQQAVAGVPF